MRQLLAPAGLMLAVAQPVAAENLCVGGLRDQWLTEEAITGEAVQVKED